MHRHEQRKKALIITNFIGFIGFLWNDIETLKSMGYEVHFAGYDSDCGEITPKTLENRGIPFFNIEFDSKNPFSLINIFAFNKIKRLLKAQHYDLIHCHTPITGLLTRLAAKSFRRKGSKIIYTTHGFAFTHLSSWKERMVYSSMERLGSLFCDVIITINKEDYNNAKKMFCKDVRYIHGVGVDFKKYHDVEVDRLALRNQMGIKDDQIMILSVGELSPRKNHQVIIRALSKMKNKNKYVFVLCGKGVGAISTERLLLKTAKETGVNLVMLGFRTDIPQIVACSDMGAIPSIREGLGLAGIQSLCAGIPLIGSSVQGMNDYIMDGETGFKCHPFDQDAFSQSILKLSDAAVRKDMEITCIKMAKAFDVLVSKKQMETIYLSVLGEN
jgi:glycosyltransferase involved in cell wall biosynthesis